MKAKIIATVLVIMAVAMYTTAVINFMAGQVLPGITDLLMACSDVIFAWVLMRQAFMEKVLKTVGKSHYDLKKALRELMEALEKGVPATLTVKDGKGTVTLGHDDNDNDQTQGGSGSGGSQTPSGDIEG